MADVVADLVAQLRLAVDQASFNKGSRAADQLNRKLGSTAPTSTAANRALTGLGVTANSALSGLAARSGAAQTALTGLGAAGVSSTAALGIGLGVVAAGAAAKFAFQTAQMASAVQEQLNGVRVTFGAAAADVEDFASRSADAFAIAEVDALKASAQLGGIFKAFGAGTEEAARFSTEIVALAGDLASFKDISPEEALTALRAGLVGEAEPLRRLGVSLSEATVQAKALELGLVGPGEKLTDLDKITARYALITEQTADAQGDFARTSDSLANQQRALSANLKDLGADIGEVVLPAVTSFTASLVDLVEGMEKLSNNPAIKALLEIFRAIAGLSMEEANTLVNTEKNFDKAGAAAGGYAEQAREAAAATDELAKAQDNQATAALELIDLNFAVANAQDARDDAAQDVAEAEQELNDIVNVQGEALEKVERVTQTLADAKDALAAATKKASDAERELAELNATEAERALRGVERATHDLDRARKRQQESAGDVTAAEEALAEAIKTGASANEKRRRQSDLDDARFAQREAAFNVSDAQDGLTDAQRQQRDGTDELQAAQERYATATASVGSATRSVQVATKGYNETLAEVGPNSDAAKKATERLDDAQRNLDEKNYALIESHFAVAEELAKLGGETLTAKDRLDFYRQSLRDARVDADDLATALRTVNSELGIPGSVSLGSLSGKTAGPSGDPSLTGANAPALVKTGMNINGPITIQADDPGEFGRRLEARQALNRVGSPP